MHRGNQPGTVRGHTLNSVLRIKGDRGCLVETFLTKCTRRKREGFCVKYKKKLAYNHDN